MAAGDAGGRPPKAVVEAARDLKASADEMWLAVAQFELRQADHVVASLELSLAMARALAAGAPGVPARRRITRRGSRPWRRLGATIPRNSRRS